MRLEHTLVAGAIVVSGVHASPLPTKGLLECALPGNKRDVLDLAVPERAAIESRLEEDVSPDQAATVIIKGVNANMEK